MTRYRTSDVLGLDDRGACDILLSHTAWKMLLLILLLVTLTGSKDKSFLHIYRALIRSVLERGPNSLHQN